MIDKPDTDERELAAEVSAAWGVSVTGVSFLPVGLDGQAWAYRVDAGDERFFLKLRRGDFAPAATLLPGYLRSRGVTQVVAPIELPGGGVCHAVGAYRLLLYPYHDGAGLWSRGLTDAQWHAYGQFLGQLHAVVPSTEVAAALPVETYTSTAGDRLIALGPQAASSELLRVFWQEYGPALHRLAETVNDLASRVTRGQHVVCHADIHPGNLLAVDGGPLHVVDWDAPILAPRERDLMFVYSQDFGEHPITPHSEALFRQGYGPIEPDPVLLSYYRAERHLDDVASFLASILDPAASAQSQANDLHWLTRIAETVADPGYAP
ncbi:MAG: aminoglycoside phosphotransferase family protein [Hamadaea sp.]|nr:aminoglycoside phosphotransferase family protein [Hamadaea sp.]